MIIRELVPGLAFGFPVPGGHHIRLASEGGSGETGRLCACGRALVGGDGDGDRW
jgi:hypothetical protein